MNDQTISYTKQLLADIVKQAEGYLRSLDEGMLIGTVQTIRDQIAVLDTQLSDMGGEFQMEFENLRDKYNMQLKLKQMELWDLYQSPNPEINPLGKNKLSKSAAQDRARYQATVDCYPILVEARKMQSLYERANALYRYTIPKLLDAIASRLALVNKYPDGVPSVKVNMNPQHRSEFKNIFGDLEDSVDNITKTLDTIEHPEDEDTQIYPDEAMEQEEDEEENDDHPFFNSEY